MNKLALVTGTSSGIGLHTAVLLAQAGFRVVATMRDVAKAGPLRAQAQAAGVQLDVRALDVQRDDSVAACVQGVLRELGPIDVLVNNAGSGWLGALEGNALADAQQVMDVNFFGVWRMTQAVLPGMRERGAGRIITVSSIGGVIGQPFNDAYCAAKFAVEGLMESLAPVAERLGVQVCLVEPGPVNTEFVAGVQRRSAPGDAAPAAYAPMRAAYLAAAEQAFASIGQSGADVGRVIVEAATVAVPHLRYQTSDIVRGLVARKLVDPTGDAVRVMAGARLPAAG